MRFSLKKENRKNEHKKARKERKKEKNRKEEKRKEKKESGSFSSKLVPRADLEHWLCTQSQNTQRKLNSQVL